LIAHAVADLRNPVTEDFPPARQSPLRRSDESPCPCRSRRI
jgi:hypothetical protein